MLRAETKHVSRMKVTMGKNKRLRPPFSFSQNVTTTIVKLQPQNSGVGQWLKTRTERSDISRPGARHDCLSHDPGLLQEAHPIDGERMDRSK